MGVQSKYAPRLYRWSFARMNWIVGFILKRLDKAHVFWCQPASGIVIVSFPVVCMHACMRYRYCCVRQIVCCIFKASRNIRIIHCVCCVHVTGVTSLNINLEDVTVQNCTASGGSETYGAGLLIYGTLTATNCTFLGNVALALGGAILLTGVAQAHIEQVNAHV